MSDQNDSASPGIDLSSVPEPMRSMLLKQLARMPEPMREQLLREGSPVLDRLIAKARHGSATTTAAMPASAAESNPVRATPDRVQTVRNANGAAAPVRIQTVSPGDRASGNAWLLGLGMALAAAGYFALRG